VQFWLLIVILLLGWFGDIEFHLCFGIDFELKKKDLKDLVLINLKSLRFLVFLLLTHLKNLFIFVSGSHIEGMCN